MSNEAQTYVATLKIGDITAKYVLGRLADRADEKFSCFPSIALLAAEAEKSDRVVQRALAKLREMKLISDKERTRPNGSSTSSRYYLHGPWDDYGGTGVPFATITTPKQRRAEQWAEPPIEGTFRAGTAAALALSVNSDVSAGQSGVTSTAPGSRESALGVNSDIPAAQQGVTPTSPPLVTPTSPSPMTPTSPPEPTETTPTPEPTSAPAARAAGDARRATTGSSAREKSGSAAANGAKAPKQSSSRSGKAAKPQVRMSRKQAAAVAVVEAAWPAELAALLPQHRPPALRDAILEALDGGRSPEQLANRVARRWVVHGYMADVLPGGKGISSPVGVAVGLVRPSKDCPDPMCEDRTIIDTGAPCRACTQRREDHKVDRRQGRLPSPRATGSAPQWWQCEISTCQNPGKGPRPQDGLCPTCHAALQAAADEYAAAEAARERQKETVLLDELLEDAYAEYQEREEQAAADRAAADRERQERAETQRLREEIARQHPELASFAQTAT
ncbi:helix-turn-helix domain-containing protein [Streptomyces sp. NPDC054863]